MSVLGGTGSLQPAAAAVRAMIKGCLKLSEESRNQAAIAKIRITESWGWMPERQKG